MVRFAKDFLDSAVLINSTGGSLDSAGEWDETVPIRTSVRLVAVPADAGVWRGSLSQGETIEGMWTFYVDTDSSSDGVSVGDVMKLADRVEYKGSEHVIKARRDWSRWGFYGVLADTLDQGDNTTEPSVGGTPALWG